MEAPSERIAQAADRLHSLAIHLLRDVAREDARSGLSAARLSALSVVCYGGPCTMRDLAAAERVSQPTMSSTVAGLVGDGLVTRAPSTVDGRAVVVTATPKGRRLLQRARARRLAVLTDRLTGLTGREMKALTTTLDALERELHRTPC